MTRVRWIPAGLVLLLAAMLTYWVAAAPPGPRTLRQFDPGRMADLELRMWQAYYSKENVRLFGLLVTMLREQYHYSWLTAATEGYHLARAAATFGNARANYEVCPISKPHMARRRTGCMRGLTLARWPERNWRGGWRGGRPVRTVPNRSGASWRMHTRCCTRRHVRGS